MVVQRNVSSDGFRWNLFKALSVFNEKTKVRNEGGDRIVLKLIKKCPF